MIWVFVDGIRRVSSAPAVVTGLWVIAAAVSLPLAIVMRASIERQLGGSLEAASVADGANYDWMQEFATQADAVSPMAPLASTLTPTVVGFGTVLDNLSAFVDLERRPPLIVSAIAIYLVVLTFLSGGIIDRLARNRPTRASGFFAACGVFFFRFLRLGVAAWLVYALLLGFGHPLLVGGWYRRLTADITNERTAFVFRVALYAAFVALLAGWNVIVDYAKVRAVVEDRHSALGALVASMRFVQRNPGAVAAMYAASAALFAVVLGIYALVAPDAGSAGVSMWVGFIVSQVYVIARLWAKLVFWASETALFQSRLAHAGYVARVTPEWPESPTVEAIQRM